MYKLKKKSIGVSVARVAVCAILSAVLAMSVPATTFAETYDIANGNITVTAKSDGKQYVKQGTGDEAEDSNEIIITTIPSNYDISDFGNGTFAVTISAENGQTANVTFNGLVIYGDSDNDNHQSGAVLVTGQGNVNIEIDGFNSLHSNLNCAGIQDDLDGTLTINDSNSTTGTLAVGGGNNSAGIGGGKNGNCSDIVINGGTVRAHGSNNGAGIGGGYYGEGKNITVNGGTVRATGGDNAAGIGGGYGEDGNNITITGGTVEAIGGDYGAGIGGGRFDKGTNIKITGGTVTSIGGDSAAGIGGGVSGDCSNIIISGSANVKAAGGNTGRYSSGCGAAIGSGGKNNLNGVECENITSGLYNTGSIKKYVAGTDENHMTEEKLQTDASGDPIIIIGEVDPNEIQSVVDNNYSVVTSYFVVNGKPFSLADLSSMIRGDIDTITSLLAAGNIDAIKDLYPDGYVLETGDITRFDREIFELLDQILQAGIDVKLSFLFEGETLTVTIPANTEVSLASLCNEDGYCDFINIYRIFVA